MSQDSNVSNSRIKRALWYITGMVSLAMAYIGFITPGIPFSIFLVFSAYCFIARVVKRCTIGYTITSTLGPFLTNWVEKRIFPQRMKYAMVLVMSSSLAFPVVHHVQSHCCSMVRWLHGCCCCLGMEISRLRRRI